ncbi:hypothetical protein B0H19DRAFT_1075583 [Mycena capillaripes]|nr:hypothetical protein B0H19DRAFT_1075583 [Mycena capillaripes]
MSSSGSESPLDRSMNEDIIKTMLYHDLVEKRLVPPKELGILTRVSGIPLKQIFPADWNWHFQSAYLKKYGPNADLAAWKRENCDFGLISYMHNLPKCNQDIATTTKVLLEAEGLLAALAIEQLVDGDFEAAWTALDVETKQGFVLDGLVRGAFNAREESRFDCPEMSLFGLIGDGEYSLVNLLKAIVAHDPTGNLRVKSLYLYTHPAVEREYALYLTNPKTPDDLRAFGHLRMIQRNLYIVQALIGILEAYTGKPAPKISIKEEREAAQREACHACGTSSIEEAVVLRKCSGCKLVSYCSSECQHHDWREHKKLCGRQGTRRMRFDPALVTPAPEAPAEFIGCPAPEAGFVRSPALWRQIWYLSKKDSYRRDYHVRFVNVRPELTGV